MIQYPTQAKVNAASATRMIRREAIFIGLAD